MSELTMTADCGGSNGNRTPYPDKIRVTDAEIAAVGSHRAHLHPEWNYTVNPRP